MRTLLFSAFVLALGANALALPIDYKLYLGKASDRQKVALYRKFFPDASEFEAREFVESACASETMAEFQGILLAFEQDRENWAGNKRAVHTAA